jgi:photosystem II stability/assembly factor-like uncharacterized protein
MIKIYKPLQYFSLLILLGFVIQAMANDQDAQLDIEYSQRVPLATQSMMLDLIGAEGRLIAVGERGHIILSDDDGETWSQADTVPTRSTLTSLFSMDGRIWAAGHDSVILTSGDVGKTWTRQFFDPDRHQPIMDIHFFDQNQGIAIGAYGLMLLTGDGGNTWEDWAVNDEDDAHLNAMVELSDGTLLIAGEAGFSYRSRDRAQTWEPMAMPYQGSMFGAVKVPGNCVLFYGLRGHIMKTCDQGDNWEELQTDSETTLLGAAMHDDNLLLVGNSGRILAHDLSGGFTSSVHSSGVDLAAALELEPGRLLLAGEDGIYFYPEQNTDEVVK